jgi:hypothetical protein
MDSLIIEATEDSPLVIFDVTTNRFSISGESRPENAGKFYSPIIDWLVKFEAVLNSRKQASSENVNLIFQFKLDYFNSTSAKYLFDVILALKDIVNNGYNIAIEWHYDKRDDDMLEAGEEFSKMVGLKFLFVEL